MAKQMETADMSRFRLRSREHGEGRRSRESPMQRDDASNCPQASRSLRRWSMRAQPQLSCGAPERGVTGHRDRSAAAAVVLYELRERFATCVRCRFGRNRKIFKKTVDREDWRLISGDNDKPIIQVYAK